MLPAARTLSKNRPTRVGNTWHFPDGTVLPVVGGGSDDDAPTPPEVPDDLATLDDDALAALDAALVAEFDRHLDEKTGDVAAMTALAESIDKLSAEKAAREQKAADDAEAIAKLSERVHGPVDTDVPNEGDEGDGGDGGDDPGEPAAPGDGGDGAGAQADEKVAVTAGGGRSAPKRASASGTARRAGQPRVTNTEPQVVITAAADLPGLNVGAEISMVQVAQAMHDRARGLSDGSGRVPVATVRRPIADNRWLRKNMSQDAMDALVADACDQQKVLVAAGGWCTPSQNMYDLLALDGATGLLDVPQVGIERGGMNIPSYIGIDAADGALWVWAEDQDALKTVAASDIDVASNVATVTTAAPHLLVVGDMVNITNSTNPALNGPHNVATVADATHFTFAVTTADATNATATVVRQKGCFRIPCPTWTDYRLTAYGLCIEHGNLTDTAFPELTARYNQLVLNAHLHRMSAVNLAKILASTNSDAVTMNTDVSDTYGNLMSAVELQAVDYRSQHKISDNVVIEVLFPTWTHEILRTDLAMRATGEADARAVSDAQLDAEMTVRKVRAQFLEDYQPMWNGTARTAWPTTVQFTMYPAGDFVEGNGGTINLGVQRDSTLNKTNDFTVAWTEDFSLLGRRGPKARRVTVTLDTDGKTGGPAD